MGSPFAGRDKTQCRKRKMHAGVPRAIWKQVLHRQHCVWVDPVTKQGCETEPMFGDVREGAARYCKAHKRAEHLDVRSPRCKFVGCQKHPIFGDPVVRVPLFCSDHRYKVSCIAKLPARSLTLPYINAPCMRQRPALCLHSATANAASSPLSGARGLHESPLHLARRLYSPGKLRSRGRARRVVLHGPQGPVARQCADAAMRRGQLHSPAHIRPDRGAATLLCIAPQRNAREPRIARVPASPRLPQDPVVRRAWRRSCALLRGALRQPPHQPPQAADAPACGDSAPLRAPRLQGGRPGRAGRRAFSVRPQPSSAARVILTFRRPMAPFGLTLATDGRSRSRPLSDQLALACRPTAALTG